MEGVIQSKKIKLATMLTTVPLMSFADTSYLTKDSERLVNLKPDYHQYEAEVVEVVDGDTIRVKLHALPGLEYVVDVRSRGIDAPEIKRAECDWEQELGQRAKEYISERFERGRWVLLENLQEGSFSGRVVADVKRWHGNQRWESISDLLLSADELLAVEYDSKNPFDWCQTVQQ
ncbi:MAG: hypothetical protein AAFR98_02885 [Pseudomonadota bacterium]